MEELLIILGMLVLGGLIPTVVNAVCFPPDVDEEPQEENEEEPQQYVGSTGYLRVRQAMAEENLREMEEIDRRLEARFGKGESK